MRKLEQNQDKIESLKYMSPPKSEFPKVNLKNLEDIDNNRLDGVHK